MHNILHISDIHFNGDYDGQFDVKGHFEQILNATKDQEFAAVALTGDLADNGSYTDYLDIFSDIRDTFGQQMPILVTPGNHDNRLNLQAAYSELGNIFGSAELKTMGSWETPGDRVDILSFPTYSGSHIKLIAVDTAHKDIPVAGINRLYEQGDISNTDTHVLFTHMPLIRPFHRFMNGEPYSIDDGRARFLLRALDRVKLSGIFCGHYHCASVDRFEGWTQYVAPASQCQLDPFSTECSPSGNYPGYAVITIGICAWSTFHYIAGEPDEKQK